MLRLQAPSVGAKHGDGITYAGQTFDGSSDGKPRGERAPEAVPAASATSAAVCFDFSLPPLSAAMLVVG